MSNHVRDAGPTNGSDPNATVRRKLCRADRRPGFLALLLAVGLIVAGGAGLVAWPSGPDTVLASTSSSYGPGIGADSLANTQVGGPLCRCSNSSVSYRFRASTSSKLVSARVYLVDGSGYSGGNGGTLSISVQTDNGSAAHAPSGTVLASTTIRPGNPVSIGYLPLVTFSSPAALTAGRLYHLVFRNTDASPTVNYVSLDGIWTWAATTPRQPGLSDLSWAQLLNTGRGWAVQRDYTPILDLGYSNGVHGGMGYMEVWVNVPQAISGRSAVREYLVPKADHAVSSVSVRLRRVGGSSPLSVQLETAGGSVLASGSIAASAVGSRPTWATARLSKAVTLRRGSAYALVVSTSSSGSYSAFGVERGNHYSFTTATYFTDGYAQYTTGSGWRGFTDESGRTATNADLQFIFHDTAGAPAPRPTAKAATAPKPTARAQPRSASPSASPSAASDVVPASMGPSDESGIALVPASTASSGPTDRAFAVTRSAGPGPAAALAVAGITVVLLGGVGFALRRRARL